jgi:hypothetical protein
MKIPEQTKQEAEAAFERANICFQKMENDLAFKELFEAIRLDPTYVKEQVDKNRERMFKEIEKIEDSIPADNKNNSMAEALSQEEIDHLLTATNENELKSEDLRPQADIRKIKLYDFKRPDKLAGEPLDVMANGALIAHGEAMVIDENFGVRITKIIRTTDARRPLT